MHPLLLFPLLSSLFSLLFANNITAVTGNAVEYCHPHQRSLLLHLKNGLYFDYGDALVSWKPGSNCCYWEGVTCDGETGHIIGLDLHPYSGNITSTLFNLTSLQALNLSFSEPGFSSISQTDGGFEKLVKLTHLNLTRSPFVFGRIPIGISRLASLISLQLNNCEYYAYHLKLQSLVRNLPNLKELYIASANMSSDLNWTTALSTSLPQLQVLSLESCCLPGVLPKNILTLKNWTVLNLSGNTMLSGIMLDFPKGNVLQTLRLSGIKLSGNLTSSVSNVKYLTELDLSGCGITGAIPSSIGNLTQLVTFDLSGNTFTGVIPSSIGNLRNLIYMDLSKNNFIGVIPSSIGNLAQLIRIDLSRNSFAGVIPTSIGNLTRLIHMDLSENKFTGVIPSSIGNLSHLVYLSLSFNTLSGRIPVSLFCLPTLDEIYLSDNQLLGQLGEFFKPSTSLSSISLQNNQLQGQIPRSLFQLPSLEYLDLSSNNFNGTVEPDMVGSLKNLHTLILSNNKLSIQEVNNNYFHTFSSLFELELASCGLTKVPAFLRYQNEISFLDLSDNIIGGGIPKWIWNFSNIDALNLSHNLFTHLEGPIDLSMSSFSSLDLHSNMLQGPIPLPPPNMQYLDCSNNNFSSTIPSNLFFYLHPGSIILLTNNGITGKIPTTICQARSEVIDFASNNLNGSIPRCLFKEENGLRVINLRGNQLQGTIPQVINKGCNLEAIILNDNLLKGPLPRSLINCNALQVLDLGYNHIAEPFPFWLGHIVNLTVLILRANAFYGPVESTKAQEANNTFSRLQIFDISSNHFNGDLPSKYFYKMRSMMSSSIIASGDDSLSTYYTYRVSIIYEGREITFLRILKILYTSIDFSDNGFVGDIPEVIGELQGLHILNLSYNSLTGKIPSVIGNMKQLESLDLSANHLSDVIPQELTSLTFLSKLNLSNNNLVGRIPQGNQLSTFSNNSFLKNQGLCGFPLSKQCGNANQNKTEKESPSESDSSSSTYVIYLALFIGLGFGVGMAVVLVLTNVPWKICKGQIATNVPAHP